LEENIIHQRDELVPNERRSIRKSTTTLRRFDEGDLKNMFCLKIEEYDEYFEGK
jgi:hypothetical protein